MYTMSRLVSASAATQNEAHRLLLVALSNAFHDSDKVVNNNTEAIAPTSWIVRERDNLRLPFLRDKTSHPSGASRQ